MLSDLRNKYEMLVEKPKARDHYEDLCLGGSIILKECQAVDWTDMTQDRAQGQAVLNRTANIRVP
jgi:hypothetical protein